MKIKNQQVRHHAYNIAFCYYEFEDHDLLSGQGPLKSTQTSVKASSANPQAQKPAAYRPPHAKNAAAIQAQVQSHTIYDLSLFLFLNLQQHLCMV